MIAYDFCGSFFFSEPREKQQHVADTSVSVRTVLSVVIRYRNYPLR